MLITILTMAKYIQSLSALLIILINTTLCSAQTFEAEVLHFQEELNKEYLDPEESPLYEKDRAVFTGHPFFKTNKKYHVTATFELSLNAIPFAMPTTTDRLPIYKKYGTATFTIDGEIHTLSIFQNQRLKDTEEYKDYLFLPFTDLSNGEETYGGGRFMDLKIPEGDTIVIDFNTAYHPLCAYNSKYSCPIPPEENKLPIHIAAGVQLAAKFKH